MFYSLREIKNMLTDKSYTTGFQKILLNMPLRAERLSLEKIEILADMYGHSEVKRFLWRNPIASLGETKRQRTGGYYLHIDPLTPVFRSLQDFFSDAYAQRRFLLGCKGTGKTFNVLLALNWAIRHLPGIKPCYISFDLQTKKVYVKNPLSFASKQQWHNNPPDFKTFEEYIQWANVIVFDEIHYLLEWIIETGNSVEPFILLLEQILQKNCKVLLISENILISYAEIINQKRLDDLCLSFGMYPKFDSGQNFALTTQYDVMAFREITGLNISQLILLCKIYDFTDAEPYLIELFASSSCTARAFFKIMKGVNWHLTFESFSKLMTKTPQDKYKLERDLYEISNSLNPSEHKQKNLVDNMIFEFIRNWGKH